MVRRALAVGATVACATVVGTGASEAAVGTSQLPKTPVAYGTGGGAATMSPYATGAAIKVLKHGGNAVDAAVAAAAALGVSEPFVAGPGGGGFFLYYRHKDGKVFTIDGREKAPAAATPSLFLDAHGNPLDFETAVESGLSVGVPGQVATWGVALDRFGTKSLRAVFKPAERIATSGVRLDAALVKAITDQQTKLAHFPASAAQYLPGGKPPAVGTVIRNPALARTYRQIAAHGWNAGSTAGRSPRRSPRSSRSRRRHRTRRPSPAAR